MSIEKITSKIISDAESTAAETMQASKVQCDEILAEASKKAEAIIKNAEERGADEKEKLITRRKAVAEIDGRKIILEEKQKLISGCFDKALEKIVSMGESEYAAFLVGQVKLTGETQGELILSKNDAEKVGGKVVELLKKEIPDSNITLSKETRNIKGGFLLKKGAVYVNGTIEALIEEAKEELVGEVADRLFQ